MGAHEPARGPTLRQRADLLTPMALRVAATLRLADHVDAGRDTAAALAAAVGADAGALERLLRHLVTVGVLARDAPAAGAPDRYRVTERGAPLRDAHPSGTRALLDVEGALGRAELALVHLLDAVRTGEPVFARWAGRPFWDDLAADPARRADFDARMGADVATWAPPVVAALDWGAVGHVVDVGGGDGTLLAALLRAAPGLRGTVVEQPGAAAAARRALAAAGLADRADVVAGSFFDPLPPGAGAYVLSAVLHNWGDGPAAAVLGRCAEAAGATGRVVVVEKTGAGGGPSTAMDLRGLAWFGGRERDVAELATLGGAVGLRLDAVHTEGDLSVLTLVAGGRGRAHATDPTTGV